MFHQWLFEGNLIVAPSIAFFGIFFYDTLLPQNVVTHIAIYHFWYMTEDVRNYNGHNTDYSKNQQLKRVRLYIIFVIEVILYNFAQMT